MHRAIPALITTSMPLPAHHITLRLELAIALLALAVLVELQLAVPQT